METKRSRGFGFVVFTSSDIVEKVILNLPCQPITDSFSRVGNNKFLRSISNRAGQDLIILVLF
jgi:RNA recognition motif-containing protein